MKFHDDEFKTSSFTGIDRWACVQVAMRPDCVAVRNSRDISKTTLEFTIEEWNAFIKGIKEGEFDL